AAGRAAAGKAPVGRVAVTVSRRGSRVCFACTDDGAGVDLEAVRAAAERRGMPRSEAGALGPDELGRLLLGGGISTSAAVTELAGRGVGLDLVRATAEGLGGEVALRTERGRGTTVELIVPVLASSLDSLVVEASGQVVAIPLSATRRTLRVLPGELSRGPEGETVTFDGAAIPFVPLGRVLGRSPGAAGRACAAVVVESGGALLAVGVERLVGVESVVLRPLPALAPPHPAVLGVWLDAAGRARVVVDPAGLRASASAARGGGDLGAASGARPTILVVDDSLTTRMLEQSILESAGYEVDVAVSGEEALAKARERSYGLFLVDVEMPGMDGFTFIERARAEPTLRAVPAILVTSRASAEDRARGAAAGAVGHIEKSEFNQTELVARIRGLIG
ncbi:MAG: response regulator, partial [Deltaproteobacteria bacterium]|nr:response regulator [Deltaproteobacteria bacterium]